MKKISISILNMNSISLLLVVLLAAGLVTTLVLIQKPQDIRQHAASFGNEIFIFLDGDSTQLPQYQTLANSEIRIDYRTANYNPLSEIDQWDKNGWHYYVTVASSDFPAYQHASSEYITDTNLLTQIASRPGFDGFYFHEMMTYRASINGWNWDIARDTLDWGWINTVMNIALSKGKKVIWSEPTYAWQTLYQDKNKTIDPLFRKWSAAMVPMYATNFTLPEQTAAKQYAKLVSQKYSLPFGQSHQAWHWRDTQTEPTQQGSFNLAFDGLNNGALYFQFEGALQDYVWGSQYMLGIRQFASVLSPTPTPVITFPSRPIWHFFPIPFQSKAPVYPVRPAQ